MSQAVSSKKPLVMGGKLKLKGSGGSSGSRRTAASVTTSSSSSAPPPTETKSDAVVNRESSPRNMEHLTASQRRHLERKIEKEKEEAKKLSKTSFRERVEQFNNKLAQLTEHNDIPRISAAGNG
jgi:protein FAM32A